MRITTIVCCHYASFALNFSRVKPWKNIKMFSRIFQGWIEHWIYGQKPRVIFKVEFISRIDYYLFSRLNFFQGLTNNFNPWKIFATLNFFQSWIFCLFNVVCICSWDPRTGELLPLYVWKYMHTCIIYLASTKHFIKFFQS